MNLRLMPRTRRRLRVALGAKQAFTADVSPTGFSVELMACPRPGAMVHGEVLVGEQRLPFTGEVRWVKQGDPRLSLRSRAGVRFTGIDAAFYALFEAA